jgi:hypothetical protein
MGSLISIEKVCKNFKCRSSCSLNDEIIERIKLEKRISEISTDELKELMKFHTLRKWVHKQEIEMVDEKLKRKYSLPYIQKVKQEQTML